MGQSSHNINLIQEALTLQLRALTLTKEASFIYNEIAINYSLLKNPEEAKRNFVFAIDYAPSWSIPFSNFAQQFLEEDIPKALRIARHATRLSPKNSYAYNILGIVYFQSKDFERAENSFLKAIQLDASYPDAFYNLACVKSVQGDFTSGFNYLESAIQYGFSDWEFALLDPDLTLLRQQIKWNELMKKYFPDQFKDK